MHKALRTFIEMPLELVELTLSKANMQVYDLVCRCRSDSIPFVGYIVGVLYDVGRSSAHGRGKDSSGSN